MIKNIVSFEKVVPTKRLVIDYFNPDLFDESPELAEAKLTDFVTAYLPYTALYKEVVIRNFFNVPVILLERLTHQYLHGTEITYVVPKRGFKRTYVCPNSKPFYRYSWVPLDFTKPIPKSLATFRFMYNGKETTYLDAIKSLKSLRYLPKDIWDAIDRYSQQRITLCRRHNEGYYTLAEEWFKQLTKDAHAYNLIINSPNKKTYFEAMAELDFERNMRDNFSLRPGEQPLTTTELNFLRQYAPAYGIDVPQLVVRYNFHKTRHGYTTEPEFIFGAVPEREINRCLYDARNSEKGANLPGFVRKNLMPRAIDNDRLLKDAYTTLCWMMEHASELPNDGLIDGYAKCPVCGSIYRENDGCECGAVEGVEFINTPNLFYGDAASFESNDVDYSDFN